MSAQVKLEDLIVDAYATFGRQQILCSATPLLQYDKQKQKHTDERLGTKYTVACPSLGMRSITVKVLGPQEVFTDGASLVIVEFDELKHYFAYNRDKYPYSLGHGNADSQGRAFWLKEHACREVTRAYIKCAPPTSEKGSSLWKRIF